MTPERNLITDVPGLRVGNAEDAHVMTGVTVLIPDAPTIAAVDVRGGGPGTRESTTLGLASTVPVIHGLVLSGGSAFGLSAATGAQTWLAKNGIGFEVGTARVPIVPQAILFDLLNGGDKAWSDTPPYEALAKDACEHAARDFAIGSYGAGFGASTATVRGGLGSASAHFEDDIWIGALVAANPVGCVTMGDGGQFWAAPFERDNEFGGLAMPPAWPDPTARPPLKSTNAGENTTLGVIATNAQLTKVEVHRLAIMAQAGLAHAIRPVHTPLDGDLVYGLATGASQSDIRSAWPPDRLAQLGARGAAVMARAIARGVYHAAPAPAGWRGPPAWQTMFGS